MRCVCSLVGQFDENVHDIVHACETYYIQVRGVTAYLWGGGLLTRSPFGGEKIILIFNVETFLNANS